VTLEHLCHALEEARHDPSQGLRIQSLPELSGVCDVREENGDRSPSDGHVLSVGLGPRSA
jgi:hypothetical protein